MAQLGHESDRKSLQGPPLAYNVLSYSVPPALQAEIAGGCMALARADGPATPPQEFEADEDGFGGLFAE